MKKLFIIPALLLLLTGCGGTEQPAAKVQSSTAPTVTESQTQPAATETTAAAAVETPSHESIDWRCALNHMTRALSADTAETILGWIQAQTPFAGDYGKTYDANFYFDQMSGEGHGYYLQLTDQGWLFLEDGTNAINAPEDIRCKATRMINEEIGDHMPQTAAGDQPEITFHCHPAPVGTGIIYAAADQTDLPYDAVKSVSLTDSAGNPLYIDTLDGGEYLSAMADLYGEPTVVLLVDPTNMPAGDYTVTINGSQSTVTLLPEQDYTNLQ